MLKTVRASSYVFEFKMMSGSCPTICFLETVDIIHMYRHEPMHNLEEWSVQLAFYVHFKTMPNIEEGCERNNVENKE